MLPLILLLTLVGDGLGVHTKQQKTCLNMVNPKASLSPSLSSLLLLLFPDAHAEQRWGEATARPASARPTPATSGRAETTYGFVETSRSRSEVERALGRSGE